MAQTAINIVDAPLNEIKAFEFSSAASLSDGFAICYIDPSDASSRPHGGADNRLAFLIQNTSTASGTVTFKKGNGIQGVADLEYTVSASTTAVVWIDSGLIKNVTGANKGKVVVIPSAATMKIAAVHLGQIGSSVISAW